MDKPNTCFGMRYMNDTLNTNKHRHDTLMQTPQKKYLQGAFCKKVIVLTVFMTCINFIINISQTFQKWSFNVPRRIESYCDSNIVRYRNNADPEYNQNPREMIILCKNVLEQGQVDEKTLELQNNGLTESGTLLSHRFKRDDSRTRNRESKKERKSFKNPIKRRRNKNGKRRRRKIKNSKKTQTNEERKTKGLSPASMQQQKDTKTENKMLHLEIDNTREPVMKTGPQGSVMDCWKLADEGYNKIQDFAQFHHGNGTVTVKEQGFYFIYSQLTYFDHTGRWSHTIDISNKTLAKCLTSEWGLKTNPDTNEYFNTVHQCYTARSTFILSNQVVSIRNMYANRTVHADSEMSFWGIIKL